jgi:hypothetical protein
MLWDRRRFEARSGVQDALNVPLTFGRQRCVVRDRQQSHDGGDIGFADLLAATCPVGEVDNESVWDWVEPPSEAVQQRRSDGDACCADRKDDGDV